MIEINISFLTKPFVLVAPALDGSRIPNRFEILQDKASDGDQAELWRAI